jgi:prepilin-type N-terminal cleavage/methylation domain-containing protein
MPNPRSAESMQKRGVSGFTLLEIIIVMGIIGVIFGTLFAVYSSTLEISAQVDSAEERGRKARTTLSLLESDFAGIYFGEQEENATSPRKEYALVTGESQEDTLSGGIEQTVVGFGTTNTLEFSARFPKETVSRVRYVLRNRGEEQGGSTTLVRMQQRLPGVKGGWSEVELADNVLELELFFVDESGREHSQWGTGDQEATARPVMVTVELTLGRSGSWKERYSMTVPLALR